MGREYLAYYFNERPHCGHPDCFGKLWSSCCILAFCIHRGTVWQRQLLVNLIDALMIADSWALIPVLKVLILADVYWRLPYSCTCLSCLFPTKSGPQLQ